MNKKLDDIKDIGWNAFTSLSYKKNKKILRNPKAKQRNIKQYGKVNVLNMKQHKV